MRQNPVVILPIGAMEEHGSHLPLGSDTYEIEFVVGRIAEKSNAIVLPTIDYGVCNSTYNFPGTFSLRFETLRSLIEDILAEVVRHGARRVLVISGHAGGDHLVAIRMAAKSTVREHANTKIMVMADYELIPDYKRDNIPSWDGHAGMVETSRMLNIRPDISRRGRTATKPERPEFMVLPDPERLFPSGVAGDPRRASPELGKRLDDFILRKTLRLIRENLGEEDD